MDEEFLFLYNKMRNKDILTVGDIGYRKKPKRKTRNINNNYFFVWTEKEVEDLIKYKEKGFTSRQIGKLLNRTEGSINRKYSNLLTKGYII